MDHPIDGPWSHVGSAPPHTYFVTLAVIVSLASGFNCDRDDGGVEDANLFDHNSRSWRNPIGDQQSQPIRLQFERFFLRAFESFSQLAKPKRTGVTVCDSDVDAPAR